MQLLIMLYNASFRLRLFLVVATCMLISCGDHKELDLKSFSIEVPRHWKYIPQQGVDSFVGIIDIGHNDSLHFDLGRYANKLEEEKAFMITQGDQVHFRDGNSNRNEVWKYAGKLNDVDTNRFILNRYSWTNLDGKKVKIVIPKKAGRGTTGAYFPMIKSDEFEVISFQINGQNLKTENQEAVLKAINTLKFKLE